MLDSLVRVSRRVGCDHSLRILTARRPTAAVARRHTPAQTRSRAPLPKGWAARPATCPLPRCALPRPPPRRKNTGAPHNQGASAPAPPAAAAHPEPHQRAHFLGAGEPQGVNPDENPSLRKRARAALQHTLPATFSLSAISGPL